VARKHRVRRIVAIAFVVTALAAAFQPANAAGAGAGPSAIAYGTQLAQAAPTAAIAAGLAAEDAINTVTARDLRPDALSHVPADFDRVMGYLPTVGHLANGSAVAINPNGGCSVIGGGRPFDLDVACKAHDFGYDLLRYAHRRGADLGPRARHLVDDKFSTDLFTQCDSLYRGSASNACDMMAASFDAGVGFNSWRQEFGAPIAAAGKVRTVGTLAIVAMLLYLIARRPVRRLGRIVLRGARRRRTGQFALDAAAA
jgi:phospholipase A2-like protein